MKTLVSTLAEKPLPPLAVTRPPSDPVDLLLLGVQIWNEWRESEGQVQPDLRELSMPEADLALVNFGGVDLRRADFHGADLSRAILAGADLGLANLRGANLRTADLNWAFLRDADLSGADLSEAILEDANLQGADLTGADLSTANLQGADLRGANLFGTAVPHANFHEATLGNTRFGDVDLSSARGLLTVKHFAPSTIGIDTFYRSKGEIPEAFLRGAGVPEAFIRLAGTQPQKRERTYSCFVCHSIRDRRFCDRLHADLQAYGVRTWYFQGDAPGPKRFLAELVAHPRMFDKVIVVCSRHSLETPAILRELEDAMRRESESRERILFPLRIDNYMLKEWQYDRKAEVARKVVADFRGWNRSAVKYESAFKELLDALKAT